MKQSQLLIISHIHTSPYHILGDKNNKSIQTQTKTRGGAVDFDSKSYEDHTPIGKEFQADIPDFVGGSSVKTEELPYKHPDTLLWDPNVLPEEKVDKHLASVGVAKNGHQSQRSYYNEEVALYELHKCNYNGDEANRRYLNRTCYGPLLELWTDEEKQIFFQELKKGKDFHAIRKSLVHKSTQELVDFYYMTKKCRRPKCY